MKNYFNKSLFIKPTSNFCKQSIGKEAIHQESINSPNESHQTENLDSSKKILNELRKNIEQSTKEKEEPKPKINKWEVFYKEELKFSNAHNNIKNEFFHIGKELFNKHQSSTEIDYMSYEASLIKVYEQLAVMEKSYSQLKPLGLTDEDDFSEGGTKNAVYLERNGWIGGTIESFSKGRTILDDHYTMSIAMVIEMEKLIIDKQKSEKRNLNLMAWNRENQVFEVGIINSYDVSEQSLNEAKNGEKPCGFIISPELEEARANIQGLSKPIGEENSWGARFLADIMEFFFMENN